MLRELRLELCVHVERENETLRTPPSLNAICRGGSPLPSPHRPRGLRPVGGGRLWRPAGALGVLRTATAAWAAILPM